MQETKEITTAATNDPAGPNHLPVAPSDKPEVGTTYEIRPDGPVSVRFDAHDPEDPQNGWSRVKRWRVLFVALFVTYTSAFNATANGAVSSPFRREHPGVSAEVFQTSSFTYLVMLGIGPLVFAPVSETFGRRPMLAILTFIIMILFLPQALAPNVASIIASRFVQGTFACIEGPVAAGVVADLFPKAVRGPAMGTFVLTVFTANATGPLCANWIAQKVSWQWVYWVQLISGFVCWILCVFFFPETRGDVILKKRCARLEKQTGKHHFVHGLDVHESWGEAFKVSCSRPLIYLFTEPIVTSLALWVGFAWGMVFLFVGSIVHVFEKTYGFSGGQGGTVLITGFIGAAIGWLTNYYIQERFYQRSLARGHGKATPEVRLYSSAVGGLLFAVGCFCFGWTARPWIHWFVPCIFITIAQLGIYTIYLATYNYLGDVYDKYSSSAQAAQSLLRNILGACFPFFGNIMYDHLTFPWASTLVGFIALAFAVVPWLLIRYGEKLRARSSIAVSLELLEGDILPDHDPAQDQTQDRHQEEGYANKA